MGLVRLGAERSHHRREQKWLPCNKTSEVDTYLWASNLLLERPHFIDMVQSIGCSTVGVLSRLMSTGKQLTGNKSLHTWVSWYKTVIYAQGRCSIFLPSPRMSRVRKHHGYLFQALQPWPCACLNTDKHQRRLDRCQDPCHESQGPRGHHEPYRCVGMMLWRAPT